MFFCQARDNLEMEVSWDIMSNGKSRNKDSVGVLAKIYLFSQDR